MSIGPRDEAIWRAERNEWREARAEVRILRSVVGGGWLVGGHQWWEDGLGAHRRGREEGGKLTA